MSYPGQERRRYPRIDVDIGVAYSIPNQPKHIDMCQIKNVNAGGMLIMTDKQLKPGLSIILDIYLPQEPFYINLVARVLDSKVTRSGLIFATRVEFPAVDGFQQDTIQQLVSFYRKQTGGQSFSNRKR